MHPEIDPLAEEETKVEIGEVIIIEEITDTITEIDQEADGTIISQVIGVTITRLTIDKLILDNNIVKMLNEHLDTEVKVEIEPEITIMLCNPNFICSRIISVSIWALHISSTHSHLYQRW